MRKGLLLALASAACFGSAGPLAKTLIGGGLSPAETVWLRLAGAALVLAPVVLLTRRAALRSLVAGQGRLLLAYGVLSIAAVQGLYFFAVTRLPVGIALLIEYLAPVLVIAWVRLVRRTRLPSIAYAGAGAAVLGLALVVQVWSGLALDALGLAAALGAACCQASFFLLSDRLADDADPIALTACGSVIASVALAALARPWSLPWSALVRPVSFAGASVPPLVLLGWLVVVATVLAYVAGVAAISRLSAPVAGVVACLEVVAAGLIAWGVLGEELGPFQLAGGAVVLLGAYFAQRGVSKPAPADVVLLPDAALPAEGARAA